MPGTNRTLRGIANSRTDSDLLMACHFRLFRTRKAMIHIFTLVVSVVYQDARWPTCTPVDPPTCRERERERERAQKETLGV